MYVCSYSAHRAAGHFKQLLEPQHCLPCFRAWLLAALDVVTLSDSAPAPHWQTARKLSGEERAQLELEMWDLMQALRRA